MEPELSGRLADVAADGSEHVLDVLPLVSREARGVIGDGHGRVAAFALERGLQRVRVARFREVVVGAEFDRLDRRGGR